MLMYHNGKITFSLICQTAILQLLLLRVKTNWCVTHCGLCMKSLFFVIPVVYKVIVFCIAIFFPVPINGWSHNFSKWNRHGQ